jgi:LysR family glycine cleavage system transcriptional activator
VRQFQIEQREARVPTPTMNSIPPPTCSQDLTTWPHVHDADRKDWHLWFQAQGIEDIGPPRGPAFDDSGLLLKAVLAGQGASGDGRPRPDGRTARQARRYHLAGGFRLLSGCPETSCDRPKVAAFRRWILNVAMQE